MSATTTRETFAAACPKRVQTNPMDRVWIQCPQCSAPLGAIRYRALLHDAIRMRCASCAFYLSQESGIWNALPVARAHYFRQFVREYEQIRSREGRGSDAADFYLALPFDDLTGRNPSQWKIRGRSFTYFQRRILPELARRAAGNLLCLDLGAGNGWLSYRLAQLGHSPVAVDLLTNSVDGLGAGANYRRAIPQLFPRFQAELDCLPFRDSQFDCAIFSASFHYSANYEATLGEAIRCLKPGGTVLIIDSPWYSNEESGRRMVCERRAHFQEHFGTRSDSLGSCEYLTDQRLNELEDSFGLCWKRYRPWYGLRWGLRPWLAKLTRRREPSVFQIYSAEVLSR